MSDSFMCINVSHCALEEMRTNKCTSICVSEDEVCNIKILTQSLMMRRGFGIWKVGAWSVLRLTEYSKEEQSK